ncbi:Suppressor of ferric uptake 1 [Entomophthora muscae]|uniref:Suppressor of ferric uptake 1 n=1 Tax=Entomophthora muscae TaxID=34485 RepID=A0ACC2SYP9_9FUNG|nr:Suppressor of ferric uptake 1 [Entomophthora muscae]
MISTTQATVGIKRSRGVSGTRCAHCDTTHTPLWRRGPNEEMLCNACGLYLRAKGKARTLRPKPKKASQSPAPTGGCPGDGHCNGLGGAPACAGCPALNQRARPSYTCANCKATTTPLWRRDAQGEPICNACGLYYKMHGQHRPVTMMRSVIKRRNRLLSESQSPVSPISGKGCTVRRFPVASVYSRQPASHPESHASSHSACPSSSPVPSLSPPSWLEQVNRALVDPYYKPCRASSASGTSSDIPQPMTPCVEGRTTTPEPQLDLESLKSHRQELQREILRLNELRTKYLAIESSLSTIISKIPVNF